MAIFFIVTLALSIVGMVLLLGIKQWELRTNNLLWVSVRPRVGNFFHTFLFWIERVLPALVRVYGHRAIRAANVWVHRKAAQGVLFAEHWLERVLHTLRHTTDTKRDAPRGVASAFLQEVAEHKKKLIRRSHKAMPKVPVDSIEKE